MSGFKVVQCCNSKCTNTFYVPRETPSECRQCETCIEKRNGQRSMIRDSLTEFTDAYIVAALWASCDDDGNPLDDRFDRDDIDSETLAAMRADCRAFYIANETHILCDDGPSTGTASQAEMAGHDFWLTRCGHGAGFWDGDWPEPHATALDDASQVFGNVDLYVGNDGKIYS